MNNYKDNYLIQEIEELAKKAPQWLDTPEGKKALEEVIVRGTPEADAIRKAREISIEDLFRPVDF